MPTYDWINTETGEVKSVFRSIADFDKQPDDIHPDDAGNWVRKIAGVNIAKRLIPSGFGIRQADEKWVNAKEITALEDSTLDMRHDDPARQEIKKEVKKINNTMKD